MDATLTQLRVFYEVARQEHFSRAAEALYVSQPAVSKSVKDLERQVGLPLFEHLGRRVRLTEAGRILLVHVERVLGELAAADRVLTGMRDGETGRLVLGASSTPGTYLLPQLLGDFRRRYPGVEVSLEISDTQEAIDRVMSGRLDLAVVGQAEFPDSLHAELFRRDSLVLIISPAHPLARKERVNLADLSDEPFVLRERGSSTREVLERALRARDFKPKVVMELGNTEAVKKTVSAGLGVSIVSEYAVDLELRAGALAARPLQDLTLHRGLYVIRRASLSVTRLYASLLGTLIAPSLKGRP